MGEWRPLHQQFDLRSGLEAAGQPYDPPLLPYEKSLISTIGCTEEEYKALIRYAMQRQGVLMRQHPKTARRKQAKTNTKSDGATR